MTECFVCGGKVGLKDVECLNGQKRPACWNHHDLYEEDTTANNGNLHSLNHNPQSYPANSGASSDGGGEQEK